ncbi:fructosamine kinase family protein [Draconibacterium sp. IB214405]|uniref:fructosamine kinase family protein n=1 Tax=Draconibacterium sp. IB214405 TaxID=3097352 RepID=UPI002A0DD8DE|nr:fructosamine kinase family protein [Draconibacterium sp. IB214405]MDX8339516.1 fructosamine kinase family protein [Draconibacterium sp. IB214405]
MNTNSQNLVFVEVENRLSTVFDETVNITSSKPLSGGCINHASKIETNLGNFFLKWNQHCESDIFTREAESLSELLKGSDENLLVPKVFCAKEMDESPAFIVTEYFQPGGGDQSEQLGRGLAKIHSFQRDDFGFFSDNYCGATSQYNNWKNNWIEFYRDNRLGYLLQLIRNTRPIGSDYMKLFEKLLDRISSLIPNEEKASLIHGDLWSGNYMQTTDGPALIDPAASYSHREMEFGIITMFGGFSARFFSAYNEVFPLEPDWRERNPLYQLYHVLNHYYLFGGGYLQQAVSIAKHYL